MPAQEFLFSDNNLMSSPVYVPDEIKSDQQPDESAYSEEDFPDDAAENC